MLEFRDAESLICPMNHEEAGVCETIYCVGDSHVCFFSGEDKIQPAWPEIGDDQLPWFRSYRLGPVLAYNLCRVSASNRGRENLFDVCEYHIPGGASLLLCFGEIDCRVHLQKQSILQCRLLQDVVAECV